MVVVKIAKSGGSWNVIGAADEIERVEPRTSAGAGRSKLLQ